MKYRSIAKQEGGEVGMSDKKFPKDCPRDCPHYHAWDMSVDDWTNACDLLKVQIDDCDMDFKWMYCPLVEQEGR